MATLPTPTDDTFLGQLESAGFVPGGDAAATRDLDCRLGGFWVPRTMSRSLISAFAEGRPERQEPGPPSMNWIEAEFTALRYFTLDGSDHSSHAEQEAAIAGYIRSANTHVRRSDVSLPSPTRYSSRSGFVSGPKPLQR